MWIGGYQKVSLINFPGRISTVVFTAGCMFRCGFCFNPALASPAGTAQVEEEEVFDYLRRRRDRIDSVVISGGEPALQPDLLEFIRRIDDLGYEIKLDTSGYLPDVLDKLLDSGLVDYVAMDVKAPLAKYALVTNVQVDAEKIKRSIQMILNSGIAHEFRSTLIEGIHTASDIVAMARAIEGADAYYLQRFRPMAKLLDPLFQSEKPPSDAFLSDVVLRCKPYVKKCEVR